MLGFVIIVVAVFVAALLISFIFFGLGYLLSLLLPLTLPQSIALAFGSVFIGVSALFAVALLYRFSTDFEYKHKRFGGRGDYEDDEEYDDYDDDEDEDDDDDEYDAGDKAHTEKKGSRTSWFPRNVTVVNSSKIGRNQPCPCGSGKKYKLCCGKNR